MSELLTFNLSGFVLILFFNFHPDLSRTLATAAASLPPASATLLVLAASVSFKSCLGCLTLFKHTWDVLHYLL